MKYEVLEKLRKAFLELGTDQDPSPTIQNLYTLYLEKAVECRLELESKKLNAFRAEGKVKEAEQALIAARTILECVFVTGIVSVDEYKKCEKEDLDTEAEKLFYGGSF